jgi:hypothetical protein
MKRMQLLQNKLAQHRILESVGICELANLQDDGSDWAVLSRVLLQYHGKLQILRWDSELIPNEKVSLLQFQTIPPDGTVDAELKRVNDLISKADTDFAYRFVLQTFLTYYAMVLQDGFGMASHLLASMRMFARLEPTFSHQRPAALRSMIDGWLDNRRTDPVSLYATFDEFISEASRFFGVSLVQCFGTFALHIKLGNSDEAA